MIRETESDHLPHYIRTGKTVVLIRGDATYNESLDEDGNITSRYSYTEYVFTPHEFEKLKQGNFDGEWNDILHHIYRAELHRVTDDLYAMANRKLRTSEDKGVWETYIAELDMWNDEVSGLADGFRVANIPLPNEPTI